MKIKYLSLLAITFINCKASAVTIEDVYDDKSYFSEKVRNTVSNDKAFNDWYDNGNLPENSGQLDWNEMPSGTRCGTYVMSQNRIKSLTKCQGHNPRYSCPTGFSRQDFGYFEAGNGERRYNWCVKL